MQCDCQHLQLATLMGGLGKWVSTHEPIQSVQVAKKGAPVPSQMDTSGEKLATLALNPLGLVGANSKASWCQDR